MLQKLLTALESALCFLKVENLVIPSVHELVPTWKERYSFSPIRNSLMKDLIFTNTLMFPTTIRLQKSLALQPTDRTDADDDKPNGVNEKKKVALPDLNLKHLKEDLN
ncbi:increased DNA methylation 1-like [Mangifera indica]|uniref:increased DNA methylation 1-like n=1 Tax=Mangifera indica TaxID=29780 RepID=UPI001CFB3BEE|nr:increased DNA methylation 1-like [Mangifera indica]